MALTEDLKPKSQRRHVQYVVSDTKSGTYILLSEHLFTLFILFTLVILFDIPPTYAMPTTVYNTDQAAPPKSLTVQNFVSYCHQYGPPDQQGQMIKERITDHTTTDTSLDRVSTQHTYAAEHIP